MKYPRLPPPKYPELIPHPASTTWAPGGRRARRQAKRTPRTPAPAIAPAPAPPSIPGRRARRQAKRTTRPAFQKALARTKRLQKLRQKRLHKISTRKAVFSSAYRRGITSYVWTTQQDSRVRPKHKKLHGKTFTLTQGAPPGHIHPGDEWGCRCFAKLT